MSKQRTHAITITALMALAIVAAPGCVRQKPAVEVPDAALGRVIIYRNGVAYFERRAFVEDELTLQVPAARVDDFLKSLTVVDAKTDKSLPISYPTTAGGANGTVAMTIELPKGRRDVRIAYVTESPAWKPSYRVMLDEHGHARLQSWAVVDNVSDETWRSVIVGVGSTSAMSFRYDLHSVQLVERETIDGGTKLAAAPPQGGSPYAVDGGNVRLLAGLSGDEVDALAVATDEFRNLPAGAIGGRDFTSVVESRAVTLAGSSAAEADYTVEGANVDAPRRVKARRRGKAGGKSGQAGGVAGGTVGGVAAAAAGAAATPRSGLESVVAGLVGNAQRVRVEGWALPGEAADDDAGLRRANTLRDRMIESGIDADRIDVVGHREVAGAEQLVRVIAIDEPARPVQAREADHDDGPRGVAHFMADAPMTIKAGHSAMVTLFDGQTRAERTYLYDPVSERGSQRYAFNAVRLVNPTDNTLDSGPITVYAGKQFLGEGLTEPIPPKAAALVPYGVDRSLVVEPTVATREEIEQLSKVERGIATTQTQRIRRTELEVSNRGHADARVFVRHRVATGWTLRDPPADLERMQGDLLLPVSVARGRTVTLVIEESMPITTAIDLHEATGLTAVQVFLDHGKLDADLRGELEAILAAQRRVVAIDDTLATRRAATETLRLRIGELSEQLVALRKVGRAQALSGHLAKRMRTLGDSLDAAAAQISDLETQRLELGIELDNLVADLSLEPARVADAGAPMVDAVATEQE